MKRTDQPETLLKLQDAATQMRLALANISDIEVIRSCINSFISHARSVTFVMQKESSEYPELEEWYLKKQKSLKDNPLLRFFNNKRVYSIHQGVIQPSHESTTIHFTKINESSVNTTGTLTTCRFEGVEEFIPESSGSVFAMCEEYFLILKELVTEWMYEREKMNA